MSLDQFIVENLFYGLCLGACMHLTTWFWCKGVHFIVEALNVNR